MCYVWRKESRQEIPVMTTAGTGTRGAGRWPRRDLSLVAKLGIKDYDANSISLLFSRHVHALLLTGPLNQNFFFFSRQILAGALQTPPAVAEVTVSLVLPSFITSTVGSKDIQL